MSNTSQSIMISPPDFNYMDEKFTVMNVQCPSCNGRGYQFTTEHGERNTIACERCDSTGKLKADIEIKWKPDYQ